MSFNKFTTFKVERDDVEILDGNLIKTASMKLPEGFSYDPDYLYLKVKAVSAGEYWGANKNDDYFPEAELKAWYKTFLSAHTFKNHENKKIENAIGDVLTAEWSDKMKCVYLVIRIDRRIAPTVVRGYEKGFMTDVSMGCRVDHVICSYCGQKAKTRFDYCEHLKTMKGKVMDNGKKVSEINIGPKFHDISAVLNGAERTAKVEGLYIHGDKVAYEDGNASLEKVASFEGSLSSMDDFFKTASTIMRAEPEMEVLASAFEKQKETTAKDVVDARKKIQEKAMTNAMDEASSEGLNQLEKIVDVLKANYTKYWDKEKCQEIGIKLREIAKQGKVDIADTIEQFLKVLDIAAINISPLEIHDIVMEAMDFDAHNLRTFKLKGTDSPELIDKAMDIAGKDMNCSSAIRAAKRICEVCEQDGFDEFHAKPVAKIRRIIFSTKPSHFDSDELTRQIFDNIVTRELPERSNHRQYVIPRLHLISKGEMQPIDSSAHFAPIRMMNIASASTAPSAIIPAILSAFIASANERERVSRFNNGETETRILKFASYLNDDANPFEKTAGITGRTKLLMTGIPLTFSYSALQRSRMNNGEQINSFNRYVAENPTNAAFLLALATKMGDKSIARHKPTVQKAIKQVSDHAKKFTKKAEEEYNIFKDASVDSAMMDKGYAEKDLSIIKYACALNGIGSEDKAEELLANDGMNYNDLQEYLKTASHCFKMDIEKNASNLIRSVGRSVLGDIILDNNKKSSVAASIPGYLADGLILYGIGKGLDNAAKKKQKGEMN